MKTSEMIALCLIFPFLKEIVHMVAGMKSSSVRQEKGFLSASVGETVTLHCFHVGDLAVTSSWYKQPFGDKLNLISTMFMFNRDSISLYNEFKDSLRFSVEGGQGVNHLNISKIEVSDSATYFCGSSYSNKLQFGQGTILNVKGSESGKWSVLQQPVSESVQPGDSVTLNCTIHTETCAGEHSVYWFRHGSGQSHPGIIYTNGDRSGQCNRSLEAGSPTQSCVYNLPKRNLSLSDAGTYYCAVASCGEILFGNGTKLDIKGHSTEPFLLVYYMGVGLVVAFILIIVLVFVICTMNMQTCQHCRVLDSQTRVPTVCRSDAGSHDIDTLHYAALNLSKKNKRSRRQRSNMGEETEVMYAGIRQ